MVNVYNDGEEEEEGVEEVESWCSLSHIHMLTTFQHNMAAEKAFITTVCRTTNSVAWSTFIMLSGRGLVAGGGGYVWRGRWRKRL